MRVSFPNVITAVVHAAHARAPTTPAHHDNFPLRTLNNFTEYIIVTCDWLYYGRYVHKTQAPRRVVHPPLGCAISRILLSIDDGWLRPPLSAANWRWRPCLLRMSWVTSPPVHCSRHLQLGKRSPPRFRQFRSPTSRGKLKRSMLADVRRFSPVSLFLFRLPRPAPLAAPSADWGQ